MSKYKLLEKGDELEALLAKVRALLALNGFVKSDGNGNLTAGDAGLSEQEVEEVAERIAEEEALKCFNLLDFALDYDFTNNIYFDEYPSGRDKVNLDVNNVSSDTQGSMAVLASLGIALRDCNRVLRMALSSDIPLEEFTDPMDEVLLFPVRSGLYQSLPIKLLYEDAPFEVTFRLYREDPDSSVQIPTDLWTECWVSRKPPFVSDVPNSLYSNTAPGKYSSDLHNLFTYLDVALPSSDEDQDDWPEEIWIPTASYYMQNFEILRRVRVTQTEAVYGCNSISSDGSVIRAVSLIFNSACWGMLHYTNLGTQKTIWTGTQVQYDAITTKDANTIYYILES